METEKTAALGRPLERLVPNPKARLQDQFHEVCRFRHLAERTERTYWDWVRRFLVFHKQGLVWRHPREMGASFEFRVSGSEFRVWRLRLPSLRAHFPGRVQGSKFEVPGSRFSAGSDGATLRLISDSRSQIAEGDDSRRELKDAQRKTPPSAVLESNCNRFRPIATCSTELGSHLGRISTFDIFSALIGAGRGVPTARPGWRERRQAAFPARR